MSEPSNIQIPKSWIGNVITVILAGVVGTAPTIVSGSITRTDTEALIAERLEKHALDENAHVNLFVKAKVYTDDRVSESEANLSKSVEKLNAKLDDNNDKVIKKLDELNERFSKELINNQLQLLKSQQDERRR